MPTCPNCGHCFLPDRAVSLEQCLLYGAKIGLPDSEVNKFYDYFESNGWMVGRTKMKSVEAAMRNWQRRWNESGRPGLVRLAAALPVQKPMSVWEINQRLEALKAERNKLLNHPGRKPNMKPYTWQDGQVTMHQDGWIYPEEVSKQINKIRADIDRLNQEKAKAV